MGKGNKDSDKGKEAMETNPYAAPAAVVDDVAAWDARDLESRKASRGKRLGAALLDGVISLIWLAPIIWGATMVGDVRQGIKPAAPMIGVVVLGIVLMLAICIINCVMLHRSGQTVGKRALDIAVVRSDGSRIELMRYIFLRVVPVVLMGMIPFVGRLVNLVDPLLIFGPERRCLHDLIADTIVVDA
ncbi:MAG TPA: RDD family protein [Rhodanobacter sp.]|nr:RDD family protein [Rhodanobacter sp.]